MKTKGAGQRHHYVPRFYLRNFAQKQGKKHQFYAFDLEQGRKYPNPTSIDKVAVITGFYDSVDQTGQEQSIEPLLGDMEAAAAPAITHLIKTEAVAALSRSERFAIALFCATQWLRVPAQREVQHDMTEALRVALMARMPPQQAQELVAQYSLNDAETAHLTNTMIVKGAIPFADVLLERHWALCKTSYQHRLLTSDNPLARTTDTFGHAPGLLVQGLQLWLPLSPLLVLGIYRREDYPELPTFIPWPLSPDSVLWLNHLQFLQASRYRFSVDGKFGQFGVQRKRPPRVTPGPGPSS